MESKQREEKKYLGVYGQGLTYVVGNVVPAWRNVSAGNEKPAWTLEHPEDKENWARHLVLIDVTGGMNHISPYPERTDATNPYTRTMTRSKMDELKKLEQDGKKMKLHVLQHISGEEHGITTLEESIGVPTISRQLEIGKKFGVFNELPPAKPGGKTKWRLAENAQHIRPHEALPAGIGATKNIGIPLVPMLVTGYESVKFQNGFECYKINAFNPLDLKKEEFWLKSMKVCDKNRELLERLRFSFRMFEPSKYVEGKLSTAMLVMQSQQSDLEQYKKNFENRQALGSAYWAASKKARYINHHEKDSAVSLTGAYKELSNACKKLFTNGGFLATLGHSVEVTRGTEMGKRLAAVYDKIDDGISCGHVSLNSRTMRKVMMEMAAFWDNNKQLAPGNFDYFKQPEQDLTVSRNARCSALLTGIRKIMGDGVYLDKQKRGVYIRLSTNADGQPVIVFPKGYSGEKLVEAVRDELNKLRNTSLSELYMSTENALFITSPFMEENQKETVKRLGKMIDDGIDRYMTPNEKGLVMIPTYRSGYIRTYENDISIHVRATIADAWVKPETMHRYVKGLKEWMKRNGMDIPEVTQNTGGMEAAQLTRTILKKHDEVDAASKIALLEKIKGEITEETNLQKKLSKEAKERNKSNSDKSKNKNDIPR